jgi:Type IIA topoisomerase (DNA gyrase/topo II, topoisomerase IV), B subunit
MSEEIINIEEKYQVKSEIEHVLSRPGMWVGSMINELKSYPIYFPSKNKIQISENVPYNAGLFKLIEEIFTNSIDEHRRSNMSVKDSLFSVTEINIKIDDTGLIEISDNGGIPVKKHKKLGMYVPFMIFGHLRTSSNYRDTIESEVVGTNGLGAKLTNIFSKEFTVETADGKNKYMCTWRNNMQEHDKEIIEPCNEHYTKILFQIDLDRFDIEKIEVGTIRIFQRRCIDAAAANAGLIINFESNIQNNAGIHVLNSSWKFNDFEEYVDLFLDSGTNTSKDDIIKIKGKGFNLYMLIGAGLDDFGFVNGVLCNRGTHIQRIQKQICSKILDLCKKNDMDLITEKDIIARFTIFLNCSISNPKYDSQAKDCLATKIHGDTLKLTESFLSSLKETQLWQNILDFYENKYRAQQKKELRNLNKSIKANKVKKYLKAGITDKNKNELWVFEGDSASTGFEKGRTYYQSAFLLKGKIRNTLGLQAQIIMENEELMNLMTICQLQFGEPQQNLKNFPFNQLIFSTDQDFDGDHISGLLIVFFATHFPELFKVGKIFRSLSPIIIASKGDKRKYYYSISEYERDVENLKNWTIDYNKGLGGLTNSEYKEMLQNKRLIQFTLDENDMESITIWFDKSTEQRKALILENTEID